MKYSLNHLEDKNIVEVKMRDRINFKAAELFSKEALKLAKDTDCSKFLIDHTDTIANGNSINFHATGDDLQQFGFTSGDKIAFLINDPKSNSTLKVAEEGNENWSTFKYFNNNEIEEAIDWLLN